MISADGAMKQLLWICGSFVRWFLVYEESARDAYVKRARDRCIGVSGALARCGVLCVRDVLVGEKSRAEG